MSIMAQILYLGGHVTTRSDCPTAPPLPLKPFLGAIDNLDGAARRPIFCIPIPTTREKKLSCLRFANPKEQT